MENDMEVVDTDGFESLHFISMTYIAVIGVIGVYRGIWGLVMFRFQSLRFRM